MSWRKREQTGVNIWSTQTVIFFMYKSSFKLIIYRKERQSWGRRPYLCVLTWAWFIIRDSEEIWVTFTVSSVCVGPRVIATRLASRIIQISLVCFRWAAYTAVENRPSVYPGKGINAPYHISSLFLNNIIWYWILGIFESFYQWLASITGHKHSFNRTCVQALYSGFWEKTELAYKHALISGKRLNLLTNIIPWFLGKD